MIHGELIRARQLICKSYLNLQGIRVNLKKKANRCSQHYSINWFAYTNLLTIKAHKGNRTKKRN